MTKKSRTDPYRSYNFRLEIDGLGVAAFSEVSGLSAETVSRPRKGKQQSHIRKLVGLRKYSNISLKRGFTQDRSLWNWYRNINAKSDCRNITITMIDEAGKPVKQWHAKKAWVHKYEGPSFEAGNNDIAVDEIEIAHEGLSIELER